MLSYCAAVGFEWRHKETTPWSRCVAGIFTFCCLSEDKTLRIIINNNNYYYYYNKNNNNIIIITIIIKLIIIINIIFILYYSVNSSSKATLASLIGDTVHNTGISLLLSSSMWLKDWTNGLTSLSTDGLAKDSRWRFNPRPGRRMNLEPSGW